MKLTPTLRKAAILISSLDARSADALLDQMGEAMAQRVRDAVMELEDVDPLEQERIIAEFVGGQGQGAHPADDGVEVSGSLAQAITTAPATSSRAALNKEPSAAPFAFLQDAPTELIARQLLREHPQTVAVVLAHLPPPRAAAIVKQFPADVRADVLLRVGEIDDMHPEVVREVERGLEAVLAPALRSTRRRGAGAATLQAILNAGGDERRAPADFAPPAARPVKEGPAEPANRAPQIEFALLTQLDDRAWGKILAATDSQIALLALAGAAPDFVQRLMRQLPPRDAAILQRKMETLGPLRLRDIEHAQQHVARIAAELAQQGVFRLPRPRAFATAA
jgi:flagellar motor switch protein FliG